MKENMLHLYTDQLSKERVEVFKKLKNFSNDFILAGGTAIMLQIGHRKSFDFDCFSNVELSNTLLRKVRMVFGGNITPNINTSEMLTIRTGSNVELSFVWHPYKYLRDPIATDYISVFHMDDLVANKAYTIGRRGVWRDYADIFICLKWGLYNIDKIIKLAKKKFEGEFNEKLFLEQLTYFDDIKIIPIEYIKNSYTASEIKSFLEMEVRKYLKKILP